MLEGFVCLLDYLAVFHKYYNHGQWFPPILANEHQVCPATCIAAQLGSKFDREQTIISMSKSLLQQLTKLPTLTIKDLQQRLRSRKPQSPNNDSICALPKAQQLHISSPFYPRLAAHQQNCKCRYHQRQRHPLKKLEKCLTQPNQDHSPTDSIPAPKDTTEALLFMDSSRELQFLSWKNELSSQAIKQYYFEYLKTLPNFSKFNRHDKLDCHNMAFEEFLKNHYLVILDRHASKDEVVATKTPHRTLQKVYTEGNIEYERSQMGKEARKRQFLVSRDFDKENEALSLRQGRSLREASKTKKLGFKETSKNLDLIDEQSTLERRQRGKRTKFANPSRPSFFSLIQDQQILRQICLRLAQQSRLENDEARQMMRQLAEADIELYRRVLNEMSEDLQSGLTLRNMEQQHANLLVKIVLHRIQKETQSLKNRDSHYDDKTELIGDLCEKYGWPKDEKIIGLNQFWKISKSSLKNAFSRKSLHGADSRHRIEKKSAYAEGKNDKKIKSKATLRASIAEGAATTSAFNPNDGRSNAKHIGSESHSSYPMKDDKAEDKPMEEFKFKEGKASAKKGVLTRKEKDRFNRKDRTVERDSFKSSARGRRDNGFARKGTCFFRSIPKEDDDAQETVKHLNLPVGLQGEERSSSMFYGLKSTVQHHIELNRRFLKKVEHQLIDNECQQLVIGISQTILTKKRKIRAIHNALQREEVKQSDYYNDILKYLEIYEEYCDIVVKHRKEGKTKTQIRTQQIVEVRTERERDEADLNCLLEDLRKERELKYVQLRTIFEGQDPKEELILKIPQYTTVRNRIEQKKLGYSHDQNNTVHPNEEGGNEDWSRIAQKGLNDRVHLHCAEPTKGTKRSQPATEKGQHPSKAGDWSIKLQKYRQKLGLNHHDHHLL